MVKAAWKNLVISTHAPAGGATIVRDADGTLRTFLLTPLREGRPGVNKYIYSHTEFLLTPLREGRPIVSSAHTTAARDFYSRPCGRGDKCKFSRQNSPILFLLTPLREGRQYTRNRPARRRDFYSRPCGRGDGLRYHAFRAAGSHFYSRPCGRGDSR